MKALVTGGNGFIGSHLINALLDRNCEVRCLTRKKDLSNTQVRDKLEYWEGDLTNLGSLKGIGEGIDVVYHLAGLSQIKKEWDSSYYHKINVDGTKNLFDSISEAKFVYYSSIEAVGLEKASNTEKPINETIECDPETDYGKSKLEAEKLLNTAYAQNGRDITIIRPTWIYGEREFAGGYKLFNAIREGVFHYVGDGSNMISFCYVGNLIHGTILAGESTLSKGQTYFLNDDTPYTMKEVAETIANELDVKLSPLHLPRIVADIAIQIFERTFPLIKKDPPLSKTKIRLMANNFVYDISKAKQQLGYKQQFSLSEGIKRTADWYKKIV